MLEVGYVILIWFMSASCWIKVKERKNASILAPILFLKADQDNTEGLFGMRKLGLEPLKLIQNSKKMSNQWIKSNKGEKSNCINQLYLLHLTKSDLIKI